MLYQTNAAKENMKVQLRTEAAPVYVESYVYEPGFFQFNWHSSYELLAVLCGAVDVYRDAQVRRLKPTTWCSSILSRGTPPSPPSPAPGCCFCIFSRKASGPARISPASSAAAQPRTATPCLF